ncbi:MAG: tRNA pseudouridine(13) synthase TruD [archaeon]|nr:tRNA pseudouridine(13) synthase TruD [archaeon]
MSDFALSDVPLRLGDLWGNYFEIVIREVTGSDHELAVAALNLQRHGFINYFGMQRFGSGYEEAGTHKVGVTLMRGEWKQAFDLILAPQPHENAELRAAREHYTVRHDIHSALRALPHTCHMEKGLLTALLKNNSTGYFNAITAALPRNLRLMYVHAWQSWVWNTMVTKRLTTLGKHLLVVGDLVIPFSSYKGASPEDPEAPSSCTPVLIEDEATLAQYSIEDLVMPLPGVDVIYPTHSCGFEAYSEMLTSQGLDIRDLHRPQKDLTLSGGYRHVVTIPKDFGYSIFYYDDPHADLMLSDLEILRQRPRPDPAVLRRFKAVSLQFRLPSASYATMFIREFTMLSSTELR